MEKEQSDPEQKYFMQEATKKPKAEQMAEVPIERSWFIKVKS